MHTHSPRQDPERWVQDHPEAGQEFDREVGVNVTLAFAIGIVVVSVLTFIGMWLMLDQFAVSETRRAAAVMPPRVQQGPPPEPRLQVHPETDLGTFLAEQHLHLQSWGWVDQAQDRGHIAIDEAMRLIAERGLPVRNRPRTWENPLLWRNPSLQYLEPGGMP